MSRLRRPDHLLGDVGDLDSEYAYCYSTESWIVVSNLAVDLDVLEFGFVCKDLSAANSKRGQFDRGIADAFAAAASQLHGQS